jgi:hypothetical protein
VKVTEKKKKKEKKQNEEDPKEQKDDAAQNTLVGASDAVEGPEKPKDKKKKLKKVHSTSTSTAPEISIPEKQPDNLQGTTKDKPQNLPQEKTSEHNNESSNSCLQPPPVKVLSNTLFCI